VRIDADPDPDSLLRLSHLELLSGKWHGEGLNTIWRPFFEPPGTPGDNNQFLEINETIDEINFAPINGPIPNRGLLQPDMKMFGLTYLQQISDKNDFKTVLKDGNEVKEHAGLHIEPGIWAAVPRTPNPPEHQTVVRMASIPHGTTILAQGFGRELTPAEIAGDFIGDVNIFPFEEGRPDLMKKDFPEQDFKKKVPHRKPQNPNRGIIVQANVDNPNLVLKKRLEGQNATHVTRLEVTTKARRPIRGGGTANTSFLVGTEAGPNAKAFEVSSTFWIETIHGTPGTEPVLQLQYTQTVVLNSDHRSWPHVTVGTLTKQPGSTVRAQRTA
jgi:hypothetical protein